MTFTIDTEASREEWDAFLEAIEADAIGAPAPSSATSAAATSEPAYEPTPPAGVVGDPDLIELLSEVWGFQVGGMGHR